MATVTRMEEPKSIGMAILDQFVNLEVRSMSPATARELLDIQFDAIHRAGKGPLGEGRRRPSQRYRAG